MAAQSQHKVCFSGCSGAFDHITRSPSADEELPLNLNCRCLNTSEHFRDVSSVFKSQDEKLKKRQTRRKTGKMETLSLILCL